MDSRAKQRITGAVILVAVFVLLVPELLTGPGKDRGMPAAPPAVADETGLRQYTIDLDAPATHAQPAPEPDGAVALPTPAIEARSPTATPGEAAAPESPSTEPAAPESASPESASPEMASREPQRPASTSPAPVTAQAPAPKPQPAIPPVAATTPPATTAATTASNAPKPADKPPAPKPPASAGAGFAVQLGSFAVRDNANRLAREMTAKGFAASVAPLKVNGRELYRVLVGPTRDRAAAEALAAQLRRIGQTGSIVSIS
jgi:DedD protein